MPVETKTDAYFVYNVNVNLDLADPRAAFALKDNDSPVWRVLDKGPGFEHGYILRVGYTRSDPRDFMKSFRNGEFYMFELRTDLTPVQETEMNMILHECAPGESWPLNAITQMESHGLLNGEQKEKAVENRKNSTSMAYNRFTSQTNGA